MTKKKIDKEILKEKEVIDKNVTKKKDVDDKDIDIKEEVVEEHVNKKEDINIDEVSTIEENNNEENNNTEEVGVVEEEIDNKDKETKQVKATFIQRLFAYIVDVLIITFVASLICSPFTNTKNSDKLEETYLETYESYSKGEASFEEFSNASMNYSYSLSKEQGVLTVVTIILYILYFGVLQLYLGGQTIGKKIGKISVISDNGKLTMNQLLFRSLIIDSILLDIISFACLLFMSKNLYMGCYTVFEVIQYVVLLVSAFLVMFSKKRKGLHDMIAHTSVIKC